MRGTPARNLALYLVVVAGIGLSLEAACRRWQTLFLAASHRSLFKAALLERRLPQDIVFFGTSRTGEALRPRAVLSALADAGAPPLSAFNVSTPFSSLDILQSVATRFAGSSGLKLAVVEISHQQLGRGDLPWAAESTTPSADFHARAFSWLETHSALVAERKVFVLNSLSRLMLVSLFAARFDGTEEFGSDYLASILGRPRDVERAQAPPISCLPRPIDAPPASLSEFRAERDIYVQLARSFQEHGVEVAFYVPPALDSEHAWETGPPYRELRASIHAVTGRPIWDFSECHLPPHLYRDATHLSAAGGSYFSRLIASAIAADPRLAQALGMRQATGAAHALP